MIFVHRGEGSGGIATITVDGFGGFDTRFCLLLFDVVGKVREGLDRVRRQTKDKELEFSTSSPFRRSCSVCFIRVPIVNIVLSVQIWIGIR
jgi:hypothetical protein